MSAWWERWEAWALGAPLLASGAGPSLANTSLIVSLSVDHTRAPTFLYGVVGAATSPSARTRTERDGELLNGVKRAAPRLAVACEEISQCVAGSGRDQKYTC